jgi:RimJ/RimL family protein N-acetyltransferase
MNGQSIHFAAVSRVIVSLHRRGRGIGEAMMRQVCWIAFEEMNPHRLELYVFDFNRSAIACYEKVGFQTEGLLREVCKFDDTYRNLHT